MKMMTQFLTVLFFITFSIAAQSQEKPKWAHESELGIVTVSGNTDSESYNAKEKTVYNFDQNAITSTARFLETKTAGVESAKQWEAALRYERILSDLWSLFTQHGAESDRYAGYTQRDNTDLGGKYVIIKSDTESLFSEAGSRYTKTLSAVGAATKYESYGRLYTEYSRKLNDSVSGKFWIEYLPNFTKSKAYLVNYEPSMTVMLNSNFSLKLAYLVKFHNETLVAGEKKEDTAFSTALVAKF